MKGGWDVEYMTWIPRVINILFPRGSNVGKSTLKPCCKTDVIIMLNTITCDCIMQYKHFCYVEGMTWIPRVINVLFPRGSNVGKSTLKRR